MMEGGATERSEPVGGKHAHNLHFLRARAPIDLYCVDLVTLIEEA